MKLKTIYDQLITYLPKITDSFSSIMPVSSLAYSSNTVTAVTSSPHGLITGNIVLVRDALEKLLITSITQTDGIATAITSSNHDLTIDFQSTVNISGADQTGYNGEKTLLSVPSRNSFTFSVDEATISPATGTNYLNENRALGYNGLYNVSVIDENTFTYQVTRDLGGYAGTPQVSTSPRIYPCLDMEQALNLYTENNLNEYALFFSLGNTVASRDRSTNTDASYEYIRGIEYSQRLIQNLTVYCFTKSTETTNVASIRDNFEDIRFLLIKTICGSFLESGTIQTPTYRGVTYVGDELAFYNGAIVVYAYNFEVVVEINQDDIFIPFDSVAINNLEINYYNNFNEKVKSNTKNF